MLHFTKYFSGAALLLLACAPTYAVVIQNFDTGTIAPGSSSLTYAGNAGPSAGCAGNTALYGEGTYAVATNANSCHNFWSPTGPQSSPNFMAVNGSNLTTQSNIYSQTVSTGIVAGNGYNFSAWITGLYSADAAILSLRVYDGVGTSGALLTTLTSFATNLAGGPLNQPATTAAAWVQQSIAFKALSGVVTVQVFNISTNNNGNDFGLDTLEVVQTSTGTPAGSATPEPASFLLAGSALIGLCLARRK